MMSESNVPRIVMINIMIYFLWNFYGVVHPEFMYDNFLVSWNALREGRIWTLVTSTFSHNMLWHIFINMLVFFNFGLVVENYLGTKRFLIFYLACGIAGSLGHALVCAFILNSPELPALGASGAIAGVIMFFALIYPKQKIFLFGLIPIPAIWAAIMFVGLDAFGLVGQVRGAGTPIGYGAHLGGAVAGGLYFAYLKSKSMRLRHP